MNPRLDLPERVQGVQFAFRTGSDFEPNIFRTSTQRVESKLIIIYSFVQYKWGVKGNKEYSQSPAMAVVKVFGCRYPSSEPLPMSMMHVGSWIHVPGRVLDRFRLLVFINV